MEYTIYSDTSPPPADLLFQPTAASLVKMRHTAFVRLVKNGRGPAIAAMFQQRHKLYKLFRKDDVLTWVKTIKRPSC